MRRGGQMGCTCSITLKDNLTTFIQKCGAPSILIANKLFLQIA